MKKFLLLMIVSIGVIFAVRVSQNTECPAFSQIVHDMGYADVTKDPVETEVFEIPEKFNPVYEEYNKIQKEAGYDLSLYKGKKCMRYTYLIPSENARANIIVYDGKIIGGDICSITLDGVMIPLGNKSGTKTLK